MTYEASPRRSEFLRLVARLVFCVGSIIAFWLIAPTAAHALEPSADPDEPLVDTVDETVDAVENTLTEAAEELTDAVDETANTAGFTVTEAAEELTDAVDETANTAGYTVTEAAAEPADSLAEAANVDRHAEIVGKAMEAITRDTGGSAGDAVGRVEDLAHDGRSNLEEAGEVLTGATRSLLDTASTVHLDGLSPVVATVGSVNASDAGGSPIEGADHLVEFVIRGRIMISRSGDTPVFAIRGPPLGSGPVDATAISEGGAIRMSSHGGSTPAGSHVPPSAAGSTAPRSLRDGSSFDDFAAVLAALMIALGFVRWSVHEAELIRLPLFLPLAERPG